jgi:predicted AAA+ superfamily ATPase
MDPDALVGGGSAELVRDGALLGHLFESLMALSLRVYAQRAGCRVSHLRTFGGEHEVDFIVERPDHRVVGIEVKLTHDPRDRDVRHLQWLGEVLGDDLLDALIITTGPEAYRRPDGVGVVPASLLGP